MVLEEVGTMEMMHVTQNEEQLCPNPNLGFGQSELGTHAEHPTRHEN
jgi:hypothetical protein